LKANTGGVIVYQNAKPRDASHPAPACVASGPHCVLVNHTPNNAAISVLHDQSKRVARPDAPAPTMISEALNVQPFIQTSVLNHEDNPQPRPDKSTFTSYGMANRLCDATAE